MTMDRGVVHRGIERDLPAPSRAETHDIEHAGRTFKVVPTKELIMRRSPVVLACTLAAAALVCLPAVAVAHGGDEPLPPETTSAILDTDSGSSILGPALVGGGVTAAAAAGLLLVRRRNGGGSDSK